MKSPAKNLILSSLALVFAASGQPAVAQSFSPFWMLGMGQSLLYPLSRTIGMPYVGGPYNANPLYSTNSYFRYGGLPNVFPFTNASYGPWGYRNAGMMPGYFQNSPANSQTQPRAQDEPDNSDPGANTMNRSNPYQPPPPAYTTPPAPVPSSGGAPAAQSPNAYIPMATAAPSYSAAAAPQATAAHAAVAPSVAPNLSQQMPPAVSPPVASITPPAVPSRGLSATAGAAPPAVSGASAAATASAPSISALGRPLAEGFINHLNSNYQGDMSKALGNPDTRSWARAMGVIGDDVQDGSHLSSDRLDVLGKVLKDNSLDPVSKLDTMRILLKKSAAPTN